LNQPGGNDALAPNLVFASLLPLAYINLADGAIWQGAIQLFC
jgi:hypothetical protein